MLDDTLLDDPAALQRADRDRALLALARSGARIRTALRQVEASGLAELRPDGRPRTVLVAGHGSALAAGRAMAALASTGCQVQTVAPSDATPGARPFASGFGWQLPGWAGPLDLLVLCSAEGDEPGLVSLAEQAYVRGCAIAVIAPMGSPLAHAALQVRGLPLPFAVSDPADSEGRPVPDEPDLPAEEPSALWAHLVPLLVLGAKIGAANLAEGALEAAADRLDEIAVRCRPDAAGYDNPAKELAVLLSGTVPLLWADGPVAGAVAERFAAMLADRAGRPALTGLLPEALTAHRGMFVGQFGAAAEPEDFFRDRVEEPTPLQLEVVLLRHQPGASPDEPSEPTHSVARAQRLATAHDVRLTEYSSNHTDPLQALVELTGLTDFAAVYLGLAGSS